MADPFGNIPLNTNSAAPVSMPTPTASTTPMSAPAPMASIPAAPVAAPVIPIAPIAMPTLTREPERVVRTMPHHTGVGPIIGAAIIVVLFVFGGLYFWGAHLNAQEKAPLPLITQQ